MDLAYAAYLLIVFSAVNIRNSKKGHNINFLFLQTISKDFGHRLRCLVCNFA